MNRAYKKYLIRAAVRLFGKKAELSGEYDEANSCLRKVKYSKQSAILAAGSMKEKTGADFDVYECHYCKGWHIGHSLKIKLSITRGRG